MFLGFRGQASVEYLVVTALALAILVPGSYLFLNYSKSASEQVAANQLNMAGQEIVNEAEKMYVLGRDSWVTIELSLPGFFSEAGINNGDELFFRHVSGSGDSYVVFFPLGFNLSNSSSACVNHCSLNLNPGVNRLRLQSRGNFVSVVVI